MINALVWVLEQYVWHAGLSLDHVYINLRYLCIQYNCIGQHLLAFLLNHLRQQMYEDITI